MTLTPAQLTLALEELETGEGERHQDRAGDEPVRLETPAQKPARRPLPDHLPRTVVEHATACACPQCGGALRRFGEDMTVVDYLCAGIVPGDPARAAEILLPGVRGGGPGTGTGAAETADR